MPWLLESPENMSVCGSGQWHGTDCPPKPEGGGKRTPTHIHTLTITASLVQFLGFSEGLHSQSCLNYTVLVTFPTA